jgi:peptidoglycan/xylan/chitin deacetylase (PgdA/CDA1 family)
MLAGNTPSTMVVVEIPDNAYYIRVTSRAGQVPTLAYASIVLKDVENLKTYIEEISKTLNDVSNKSDTLEEDVDTMKQRLDNLDIADVEVVLEKLNEVSVTDVANVTGCVNRVNDIGKVACGDGLGQLKKCVVSFLNDDGSDGQYYDLYPIMSELGVPYSQAIYTGQYNKHSLEMMQNIIALGGDLGSHSVTHAHLATLTEGELIDELKNSKEWFTKQGIPCDYIVYPHGESNDLVRSVSKRYYNFGVSTGESLNAYPIEDFSIKRITLGAYAAEGKDTYEYYKSKLDEAIADNAWIVYMLHSNNLTFDDTQKQHLRDIIAYARSQGVPILSMTNAYKIFGNAIKVGDNSTGSNSKHFVLSKWGDFSTNIFAWNPPTE